MDVRDVAEAQIRMAESTAVASGERFFLASGDKIMPEDIGVWVRRLFPGYNPPTSLALVAEGVSSQAMLPCASIIRRLILSERLLVIPQAEEILSDSVWMRVQLRTDKVRAALPGMEFRAFEDTLRSTVEALTDVGRVVPAR